MRANGRPALRANRVGARQGLQLLFILETHAVNPQKVGPMKPLQGPTRPGNWRRGAAWGSFRAASPTFPSRLRKALKILAKALTQ